MSESVSNPVNLGNPDGDTLKLAKLGVMGSVVKMLFTTIMIAIIVVIGLSLVRKGSHKGPFNPNALYQPGINDETDENISEHVPWTSAIYGLGLENDVITSHKRFVEARDGSTDPTRVIKRYVEVFKDGKMVESVDPADLSAAKPEDIKCKFFTREQLPSGQFTNDKDCPAYQDIYGDKSRFRLVGTASTNSVRDFDTHPVPFVGLRRPDYRVPVGAGARQVPSEYADQLPRTTRFLI